MKKFLVLLIFCFLPVFLMGQNMIVNPGFEEADQDSNGIPDGWIGYAQAGASSQLMNDSLTAHSGGYWTKCTSTNGGYYLLYQAIVPAKQGDVWSFSSFIKDISPVYPGGSYAALKISAKNSSGGTFKAWEIFQDSVTSEWKEFSNIQTMPEGTASLQAVVVVHGADSASEASYGFDDLSLVLIYENPVDTTGINLYANPGFEDGDQDGDGIPDGWTGYAQAGASLELIKSGTTANNGSSWVKCTSTNGGYYLLYQAVVPAKQGDVWSFSSFIKDISPVYPGGSYAALKISAKNSSGGTFKAWEIFQDSVTSYWKEFATIQTMPEGTASIQAVIVVHGADGAPEASYGFDDVKLKLIYENPIDTTGTNLYANPGFEDGDQDGDGIPDGWIGYAQAGASLELVKSGTTANNGSSWVKCTSTNGGYYLLYQAIVPSKQGDIWEFSSFIKDISPAFPGASYAALKISAKNSSGGTFKVWENFQDSVTSYWKTFSNIQTMPEGTASIQAVIVVHGADGAPEASYGFDDVKLKLIYENPVDTGGTNLLANPGFEDGDQDGDGIPDGWIGYAQAGASLELVKSASSAYNGSTWAKCTSTNGGYYLLYQNSFPAKEGDVFKFSSFIKDISPVYPGGSYAAIKISAKNSSGGTFKAWEVFQDSVSPYWKHFSTTQTMPEGTAFIQAVIVVHGADGAPEATYGFDDVKLELIYENPVTKGGNMLVNPGFENGDLDGDGMPDSWIGNAESGASLELLKSGTTANNGSSWVKCTSTNGGAYLLHQDAFPALEGEVWKLSSFIKDVSPEDPGGSYAALKISAKNSSNTTIESWEVYQDSVTSYWKLFSNMQTMPEGTSSIEAVVVVHAADGVPEASYGFDDVKLEIIHEMADNPGFEDGDSTSDGIPDSWLGGGSSNTHMETINDAYAHSGNYWAKVSVDNGNGYYVLYQTGFPASVGEIWSLRSFIKDVSPDSLGDFAYLKITAKDSAGSNIEVWEILQEGVTDEWQDYSVTKTMPKGTALIQPVLVVKKQVGDGIEASYGFDDVRVVKLGMDTTTVGVNSDNNLVYSYELNQNYPNPFNPSTTIKYSIKKDDFVSIKVYDVVGQEVISLVDGYKKAGNYEINFNAVNLASGMYIYQIRSGSFVNAKKMVLLK